MTAREGEACSVVVRAAHDVGDIERGATGNRDRRAIGQRTTGAQLQRASAHRGVAAVAVGGRDVERGRAGLGEAAGAAYRAGDCKRAPRSWDIESPAAGEQVDRVRG